MLSAYQILIIVQIVALGIGFFGMYSLFCSMLRAESKYLLGASACAVFFGLGYLMEMLAKSEDAAFGALCMQYCGLAYIGLLFTVYMVKATEAIRVPRFIWKLLCAYETVTLILVLSSRYHHLFYHSLSFTQEGLFPHLEEKPTILFGLFMGHLGVCLLVCCAIAVKMIAASSSTKKKWLFQGIFAATIATILAMSISMSSGFQGYESVSAVLLIILGIIAIVKTSGRTDNPVEIAYAEAFQRAKAGIIVLDEEYSYLESNASAKEAYPELAKLESGARFMHTNALLRAIEENRRLEINHRFFIPYYYTLQDEGKAVLGYVITLTDVTESESKVQELADLKKSAEEANEAKSIFLANMSHEMRTPLNAIIGLTELAQREDTVEGMKEYLPQILNSGQMLLDIISDVLDFSKAESGKVDIVPVQYDIRELLNSVINIANFRVGEKNIDFQVDVDPTIPCKLIGDDARVRQVILNFVTNAVKYTDSGFVKLSIDWEQLGDRILVKVAVSDSGRGIKKEDMNKLFTVFSRLDLKNNRNIQGSGLGLAISGQLIKLMNGTYRVESEYGQGSTFSCILPQKISSRTPLATQERQVFHLQQNTPFALYETAEAAMESLQPSESEEDLNSGFSKLSVLIVDDNPVNIKVLSAMLKAFEIKPDSALSGMRAIEMFRAKKYDIILMDHMMPEMDGIETAEKIREVDVPWAQEVIIVACTANAVKGAEEMFLSSGMNGYLCKPVKMSELEAALTRWIGR